MTRVAPRVIRGYTPVLDRRVSEGAHVVAGRNFLFSPQGPKSGFGNNFATTDRLRDSRHAFTFRVGTRGFILTDDSVLDFDTVNLSYIPVFIFTIPASELFPWSHAEVNNIHYFAKKGVGIIIYDPTLDQWTTYTDASLPSDPRAVAESGGRLIILAANAITVSALDDGQDITTSVEKGVGTQTLSALVGSSDAYAVFRSPDGFTVYTSKGIVRATRSEGVSPFRYERAIRSHAPINPFCVVSIADEEQILLDLKGLFRQSGRLPEPYDVAFSEWLASELLPPLENYLTVPNLIRMHYAENQKLLIISVADISDTAVYNIAYVQFIPREDWGIFNQTHTAFGEIQLEAEPDSAYKLGFFCNGGKVHLLDDSQYIRSLPTRDQDYFFRTYSELPARIQDNVYYMPSTGELNSNSDLPYMLSLSTGYYSLQEFLNPMITFPSLVGSAMVSSELTGGTYYMRDGGDMRDTFSSLTWQVSPLIANDLDAEIQVGMFRVIDPEFEDRMTNFTEVAAYAAAGEEIITEDWMEISGEEDWLTETGNEDWGEGFASVGFDLTLIGTNDGFTPYVTSVGEEQSKTEEAIYFAVDAQGLYHIVKVTATELLQSFHLKFLALDGKIAGRL